MHTSKATNMKKLISLIGTLLLITSVNAQSPVGKWKLTMAVTSTVGGKITDHLKDKYKKDPCLANVIYTFSADGNIITNADQCPDSTRKTVEASNLAVKWEIPGDKKIKIFTADKDIDPVTYELEMFQYPDPGGKGKRVMTWQLNFGDDPNVNNPEEVTMLMFRYVEI